ncbi:MAG: hypothetical protein IPJ88_05425 [Myxococcales bacterium]|nr:MAG: hypothetical protein IPJ88_05425 [Myxococcales bacterium]
MKAKIIKKPVVLLLFVLLGALLFPLNALAQGAATFDLENARERLRYEPKVAEVVRQTLEYFRVSPENFDGMREAARHRAALPLLAGGYRFDTSDYSRFEQQVQTAPRQNDENTNSQAHAFTIGAVWDLRELVFNPAEVQVYGIIGVQRDLLLEATRTYYLRRQLLLRLLLRPPEDEVAREALKLRIDEFTALLDVLTGGWFSQTTEVRARQARVRGGGAPSASEGATTTTPRRRRR